MKERPILFSGAMVKAILSGHKCQTRRVVKPEGADHLLRLIGADDKPIGEWGWCPTSRTITKHIRCPYGQPGDRLWLRETYWRDEEDGAILYAANPDDFEVVHHNKVVTGSPRYNWKPSIFMPRWASRITLEITGVRVERLQDISEADALAEGVNVHPDHHGKPRTSIYSPVQAYRDLWESINGAGSWAANPLVWAIDFKRVKP